MWGLTAAEAAVEAGFGPVRMVKAVRAPNGTCQSGCRPRAAAQIGKRTRPGSGQFSGLLIRGQRSMKCHALIYFAALLRPGGRGLFDIDWRRMQIAGASRSSSARILPTPRFRRR